MSEEGRAEASLVNALKEVVQTVNWVGWQTQDTFVCTTVIDGFHVKLTRFVPREHPDFNRMRAGIEGMTTGSQVERYELVIEDLLVRFNRKKVANQRFLEEDRFFRKIKKIFEEADEQANYFQFADRPAKSNVMVRTAKIFRRGS